MNAIKLIHLNIWRKFRFRIYGTFLYYGGLILLASSDWRIAVGVVMVLTAIQVVEDSK